jgi:integrase
MCNYVQSRNGTFYFRRVVPAELRPFFDGKKEWTYSLKTKDKRVAERQARLDAVAFDKQIVAAEQRLAASKAASPNNPTTHKRQPDEPPEWYLQGQMELDAQYAHEEDAYLEREPERQKILATMAAGEDLGTVDALAFQDILRDQRYDTMVAKERAQIAAYYARQAEQSEIKIKPPTEAATPSGSAGPYLDDVIPKWAAERQVRAKTADAHRAVARWFEERVGHVPVRDITRKQVLTFKDKLLAEGVTVPNANVKLTRLRTLLSYAETNDLISSNPAKGVILIDPDAGRNKRRPFDRTSLAAIFGSPVYTLDERPKDGRGEAAYWLPLLGLYTGARLEELGQMRPSDVVFESYLDAEDREQHAWVLRITEDEDDGLKLKNVGSERMVPIHSDLQSLGFIRFAANARTAGQSRLFADLKPDKYGRLTAKWGEWFGKYKREVCGITDPRLVFHSFRHTFKDNARDAKINDGIQRQLMGHAGKDDADDYGQGHGLLRLVEGMAMYRVPAFKLPVPPPLFRG